MDVCLSIARGSMLLSFRIILFIIILSYFKLTKLCESFYLRSVIQLTRSLDPTRLITFACARDFSRDKVVSGLIILLPEF